MWLCGFVRAASAQEIVTLSTRPGATQSFFIAALPQNPQAIALLFPGGSGLIRLRLDKDQIKFGANNFLVRSRAEYIKRGVVAVIVDAPSDHQSSGMSDDFRMGADHFTDISAVVADLSKRFPGIPICSCRDEPRHNLRRRSGRSTRASTGGSSVVFDFVSEQRPV